MSYIFISYSKQNSTYTYNLAHFLQTNGFDIWIDKERIEYGVNWWNGIVNGLKGCGALVVVMTPESLESEWVQKEVFLALDWKKPIFPVLLNGDNWALFILTQYIDVRTGKLPSDDFLKRLSQNVTPTKFGANTTQLTFQPELANFDVKLAIDQCASAYNTGNYSLAMKLVGQIRASRDIPLYFNPDEIEEEIRAAILEVEKQDHYRELKALTAFNPNRLCTALQRFWGRYPNYDPDGLAEKYCFNTSVRNDLKIDDLEIIEGISGKAKEALVGAGVRTFAQLAQADPSHLASILSKAGLSHVKPDTWAKQARYVVDGDAQGFESFRNTLRGTTEGLQQIEGIGPKVEAALHEAGIKTYAQLAHSQVDTLRNILQNAGLKLAKPDTWAKQAQFIVDGDVAGLEAYKKVLVGGVEPH